MWIYYTDGETSPVHEQTVCATVRHTAILRSAFSRLRTWRLQHQNVYSSHALDDDDGELRITNEMRVWTHSTVETLTQIHRQQKSEGFAHYVHRHRGIMLGRTANSTLMGVNIQGYRPIHMPT
jgi:hypothetical protein